MQELTSGMIFDNKYKLIKLIGSGGFSQVWKVEHIQVGIIQALKVYIRMDENGEQILRREFASFFKIRHPNVLNATSYGEYEGLPYLVMEFCSNGTALDRIGGFTEIELATLIRDITSGLSFLHQNNIIHKDIKPDNILINDESRYLLSDLGISEAASSAIRNTVITYRGPRKTQKKADFESIGKTPAAYRAPELFDTHDQLAISESPQSDIWALGATLYELTTTKPPFGETGGLVQALKSNLKLPFLPDHFSRDLHKVIQFCLSHDPNIRPTAKDLNELAKKYLSDGYWYLPNKTLKNQKKLVSPIIIILIFVSGLALWVNNSLTRKAHINPISSANNAVPISKLLVETNLNQFLNKNEIPLEILNNKIDSFLISFTTTQTRVLSKNRQGKITGSKLLKDYLLFVNDPANNIDQIIVEDLAFNKDKISRIIAVEIRE